MRRSDVFLDYFWWPALMLTACSAMGLGMDHDRGPLAFNLTYLTLATVLLVLEKIRPHETAWQISDGQELPDLAHTLFTKIAVQVSVIALTHFGVAQEFGSRTGHDLWPAAWPQWLQVGLGLVLAEFGLYWAHRVAHEWLPLWRFHAVHHSSEKLWFFNTGRFHFVDTLKSMLFAIPVLMLAGAPGHVITWVSAVTAFIGILTHCNVRMRCGWLNYLFNTPGLHRWHHSMDLREGNKNYGENLVLWDLLFGTYFDDTRRRPPARIGIREAMPKTFLGQIWAPFDWENFQTSAASSATSPDQPATTATENTPRPAR